jgi:hypothetical protein
VLDKLREYKYYAKLKKCAFCIFEVAFLGHVINQDGITVDPKNVASMVKWQRPTTVTEVRSFLGLAGYYRRFVQNYFYHCKANDEADDEWCPICLD